MFEQILRLICLRGNEHGGKKHQNDLKYVITNSSKFRDLLSVLLIHAHLVISLDISSSTNYVTSLAYFYEFWNLLSSCSGLRAALEWPVEKGQSSFHRSLFDMGTNFVCESLCVRASGLKRTEQLNSKFILLDIRSLQLFNNSCLKNIEIDLSPWK